MEKRGEKEEQRITGNEAVHTSTSIRNEKKKAMHRHHGESKSVMKTLTSRRLTL